MDYIPQLPGALLPLVDVRDFIRENIFGESPVEIKPLGRVEKIRDSGFLKNIIYQDGVPSCVLCTHTALNMFYSWFNSNNKNYLSWTFNWVNPKVKHVSGGTYVANVSEVFQTDGVCEESMFPNALWQNSDVANFTGNKLPERSALENAQKFKMGTYLSLRDITPQGLFRACKDVPVMFGFGGNNAAWSDRSKPIKFSGRIEWYHLTLLIDFTADGNYVALNWWKPDQIEIVVIDKTYPISFATTIEDLPDGVTPETMRDEFKLVKTKKASPVFFLDSDNVLHPIFNEKSFEEYLGKKAWKWIRTVEDSQIAELKKGKPIDIRASWLQEAIIKILG